MLVWDHWASHYAQKGSATSLLLSPSSGHKYDVLYARYHSLGIPLPICNQLVFSILRVTELLLSLRLAAILHYSVYFRDTWACVLYHYVPQTWVFQCEEGRNWGKVSMSLDQVTVVTDCQKASCRDGFWSSAQRWSSKAIHFCSNNRESARHWRRIRDPRVACNPNASAAMWVYSSWQMKMGFRDAK